MKLKDIMKAVTDIDSTLGVLDDMDMDWRKWKQSKPTTIHAIADDKIAQIDNMQRKIHDALDIIKQLDI